MNTTTLESSVVMCYWRANIPTYPKCLFLALRNPSTSVQERSMKEIQAFCLQLKWPPAREVHKLLDSPMRLSLNSNEK